MDSPEEGEQLSDKFNDLKQLAEMLEKGEVTQEEYDKIKAELMGEDASAQSVTEAPATKDPETPPASASATTEPRADVIEAQTRWWLIGTGVLMAIGSFLPWAQAGIFSAAGTDGDGIFTLIGGVVVALVGIANRASVITALGTVVVAGFSIWIVANVFTNFASGDVGSIGSGLYLTGLASLFALIAGFKIFGQTGSESRLGRMFAASVTSPVLYRSLNLVRISSGAVNTR